MKQTGAILACIGILLMLVGGWWYERSTFAISEPAAEVIVSSNAITGKTIRDTTTSAEKYKTDLKIYGKVPVSSTGLAKSPQPLFGVAE